MYITVSKISFLILISKEMSIQLHFRAFIIGFYTEKQTFSWEKKSALIKQVDFDIWIC